MYGGVVDDYRLPEAARADTPFHVGIATPDVDAVTAALGALLGLTWVALARPPVRHHTPAGPIEPSSRVIWSQQGPLHVEVVKSEPGTVYPPERGTHLHHVGLWVSDLTASIARYAAQGWRVEVTMHDDDGQDSQFAYLSAPGQPWIELVDIANRPGLERVLA